MRLVAILSLLGTLTTLALGPPSPTTAQPVKSYRIGFVTNATSEQDPYLDSLRAALRDFGYVDGKNLQLDVRYPDRELVNLPTLVDELIALNPDVLVGWESVAQVIVGRRPQSRLSSPEPWIP